MKTLLMKMLVVEKSNFLVLEQVKDEWRGKGREKIMQIPGDVCVGRQCEYWRRKNVMEKDDEKERKKKKKTATEAAPAVLSTRQSSSDSAWAADDSTHTHTTAHFLRLPLFFVLFHSLYNQV